MKQHPLVRIYILYGLVMYVFLLPVATSFSQVLFSRSGGVKKDFI